VQALPQAAFLLLLEAAVGGTIVLFWVHQRGSVTVGFTLFTGVCLFIFGVLAVWLRSAFPPQIAGDLDQTVGLPLLHLRLTVGEMWFAIERTLSGVFVVLLGIYLVGLRVRSLVGVGRVLGPVIPLIGLGSLWAAALVGASPQLGGLGTPLAVLAGALALGSALTGLSLGHWYLVSPSLSVRPLIEVTFVCLGALVVQLLLLPLLLLVPGLPPGRVDVLFGDSLLFFGVRVIFGLVVPLAATIMTWRTARIRSLDSATGLLYITAALILAGEIAARTLAAMTGVST
jgi:hypothetical protein